MNLPGITTGDLAQYGVAVVAMIALIKGLDIVKTAYLQRKGMMPAGVPCAAPQYEQRLERLDEYMTRTSQQIQEGAFSCKWRDRDEVRDMIEAIRSGTQATKALTNEMRALQAEMRATRNGGRGQP